MSSLDLSHISNYGLARGLMRGLWQMYDASGISMERSLRSALLESIFPLLPFPEELGEVHFWSIHKEAKERKCSKNNETQLLLFTSLSYLSHIIFSCLVLQAMIEWYEYDEKTQEYPLTQEKEIVCMIFKYLDGEETLRQFLELGITHEYQELLEEGRTRVRTKGEVEFREQRRCF